MFRPRGFTDLVGRRVGVWGLGVEGRSTVAALSALGVTPIIVDDNPSDDPRVAAVTDASLAQLAQCDVVVKSPGVSRYRPEVQALVQAGVYVTSALNLWLSATNRDRVIAITGTKGKSTTTSLIAFFLAASRADVDVAGNIGVVPYDPGFPDRGQWIVLEISSFQAVDVEVAPAIIGLTSLGADHLDWHGDVATYHRDKLSVTFRPGSHVTWLSSDPSVADALVGGEVRRSQGDDDGLRDALGLVGDHNTTNVALALDIVGDALRLSRADLVAMIRPVAHTFTPLPGRLTVVAETDHYRYIDDGLATSALPTCAALRVVGDAPLALIVGGFDRGVDYAPLIQALHQRTAITVVITLGPAGQRIATALGADTATRRTLAASDIATALDLAHDHLHTGTILLSPAAPSFDAYANWKERSDDFTRCVRQHVSQDS